MPRVRRLIIVVAGTLALVALTVLAQRTGAAPAARAVHAPLLTMTASATSTAVIGSAVSIADFSYTPANLQVSPGTTVTWTNSGPSFHTVSSNSGAVTFDSGALGPGGVFTFTFTAPGVYRYACNFHTMEGRITVVDPATATATATATGAAPTDTATTTETALATSTATSAATSTATADTTATATEQATSMATITATADTTATSPAPTATTATTTATSTAITGPTATATAGTATATPTIGIIIATIGPTLTPTPAAGTTVNIANFSFQPATLTVRAGTTVTWRNQDSAAHTTTADGDQWNSGTLRGGEQFSFTFTAAGTYPYHCGIHGSMQGSITVTSGGVYLPLIIR